MADGRPPGDGSDRSSRGIRGRTANQEGLSNLGRQMRAGEEAAPVANEEGLRSLGARIDAAGSKPKSSVRRSGRPRWSTRKKVVVSLLSVIVLLAAFVGGTYGYLWYRYNQISKVHINDEVAAASGAPFTILVIGSDTRVGESAAGAKAFGSSSLVTGQRSDVVQLWRVTPASKQIQIVSIPRDTVVSMLPPDTSQYGTYNRINTSYNTGANQLVKTITANFGIPINHVVEVDFSGFQDAVNALDGVYMDFPYPAKDAYSGLNITTPGCQLLGGPQALAVARSRHYEYYENGYWHTDGTSDFGRIQRQDVFLKALITAAKSKVSPLTVNAFIGSLHEGITIDDGFGFNQLIGLALDYRSFDPTALQGQTLPTEPANGFGDLGDVLTVQQPEAQEMLVNTFGSSLTTPTDPPPDARGDPNPPPPVTTTTTPPPTTAVSHGSSSGSSSKAAASSATTTPTTTPPPSFNPTNCAPS
ncbi:MAG TPA: LCP family protein [Acidimicrobiales bacterium]|nr:LCP family protein [Acidimicrobiales bacterium]